eukprot:Clim_evm117s210 gene=Clim_evmTU117s210
MEGDPRARAIWQDGRPRGQTMMNKGLDLDDGVVEKRRVSDPLMHEKAKPGSKAYQYIAQEVVASRKNRLNGMLKSLTNEIEHLMEENNQLRLKVHDQQQQINRLSGMERESITPTNENVMDTSPTASGSVARKEANISSGNQKDMLGLVEARMTRMGSLLSDRVKGFKQQGAQRSRPLIAVIKSLPAHHDGILDVKSVRGMGGLEFDGALRKPSTPGQTLDVDDIFQTNGSQVKEQLFFGTASLDGVAKIWHWESGQAVARYSHHRGAVNSINFHPNGAAITASGDGMAHVWNFSGFESNWRMTTVTGSPGDRSRRRYSLVNEEGGVVEQESPEPVAKLTGHTSVVSGADFIGRNIAVTASWDCLAKVWDLTAQKVVTDLRGHERGITHLSINEGDGLICTSGYDRTFRIWDFRDPTTGPVMQVAEGHNGGVTSTDFMQKQKYLASTSEDKTVKVWDFRSLARPVWSQPIGSEANRCRFQPGGSFLAVATDSRNVRLYEPKTGRFVGRAKGQHKRSVTVCEWSLSGRNVLMSGDLDGNIVSWNLVTSLEKDKLVEGG